MSKNLTIKIANTIIAIDFLDETEIVVPLFERFFRDFITKDRAPGVEISVSIKKLNKHDPPDWADLQEPVVEKKLALPEVTEWLDEFDIHDDFIINDDTIATFCLGGLLLYNPRNSKGRVYLLKQGSKCFTPLLRLFWIYFAQVLGESKCSFIHAAALVKDEKGFLFLGDSGAGKSSLAAASTDCIVISDDCPVLEKRNGEYVVFPSPYHQLDTLQGLDKVALRTCAEVKGIYFIIKDIKLYRERVPKEVAISLILKRYLLFFPYLSKGARISLFDLILGACNVIPVHYLHFSLDHDIWEVVLNS